MKTAQVPLSSVIFDESVYPRRKHDPATIRQCAESLEMWDSTESVAFFCRTLGRIVFTIERGRYCFRTEEDRLVLEAWRGIGREEHPAATPTTFRCEEDVRTAVCARLADQGWKTTKEVRSSFGGIDILAIRGNEIRVMEVKLYIHAGSVASGIGQLVLRSQVYPNASLWLCAPGPIRDSLRSILERYVISYMEVPYA